jgi:monovalent cation:proton antiporter-2 (CPA2) family protein
VIDPFGGLATQALVFLTATALVIPALKRIGVSPIMGFLLIGVLMGPYALGRLAETYPVLAPFALSDNAVTSFLADLGIVFLLFVIGLEVTLERLWALRRLVFGLGLAQIVLTSLAIALVALAFGHPFAAAIVIGLGLTLSSTAVVLQLLGERGARTAPVGRAAFSTLLMQDVAIVPILFVVSAMAAGQAATAADFGVAFSAAALSVVVFVALGRLLLRPFFRWAAGGQSREVFVAAALLTVIAAALASQALGLPKALGAFVAGLLLAETEFRHQIEADLQPFKGLLLGLFFVTVGMQIDLTLVMANAAGVAVGVIGLFALKAAILAPLARSFGLTWRQAIQLGLLLGQAGEFAFVLLTLARGGVIAPETADYMLLVTALSIFATPLVVALADRIGEAAPQAKPLEAPEAVSGHVIIVGFGRVGQGMADLLDAQQIPFLALDSQPERIAQVRAAGRSVHFGDASQPEVLNGLHAGAAAALVIAIDRPGDVERIVASAKRSFPHVPVYARARDVEHASRLHKAGATLASPEAIEATLDLGEAVLEGIGVPHEAARRFIEEKRAAERARAMAAP